MSQTRPPGHDLAEGARVLRAVLSAVERGELDAAAGLVRRIESASVTLDVLAGNLETPTSAT